MKPLGNDLLFHSLSVIPGCSFCFLLYSHSSMIGKMELIHIKGEATTAEILGEFKGIYILNVIDSGLSFLDPSLHIWNLAPRPLEGYKELRAVLRVGASCSGKAKQEQGRTQGRIAQASLLSALGRRALVLLVLWVHPSWLFQIARP